MRVGVLKDYPLRLWARQQEYTEELLREFALLLIGERSSDLHSAAPGRLVEFADTFTATYGPLLTAIQDERRSALERGLDRIDSRVPLVDGTPALLEGIRDVLDSADEFCRTGGLLALPRPDELVRLFDWTCHELTVQYAGGAPTPWPGPF